MNKFSGMHAYEYVPGVYVDAQFSVRIVVVVVVVE